MPNITNAQVNTAAAAVPGPYGPLTRVTDVEALPQPNDQFFIELTDQNSNVIRVHYYELTDAERILEVLTEANGHNALMHAVLQELDSLTTDYPLAVDGLYSYADYMAFVDRLKSLQLIRNFL